MSDAVRVPGSTPVPDRATSTVVADPLTVKDSVPLIAPGVPGANRTPNVVLWFGARVRGRVNPLKAKLPLTEAAEIVRFSPPVFFTVSVCI